MVSLHSRYEKMIDHEEWQYSHLALYKQSWIYALFIFYVRAVGKSLIQEQVLAWYARTPARNDFKHWLKAAKCGKIPKRGHFRVAMPGMLLWTSATCADRVHLICDSMESTSTWPTHDRGQIMDRSCSLLNSLRVVVTEKLEVLYGFVSACFGPTMTPQPLPSQLFFGPNIQEEAQAQCSARARLLRGISALTCHHFRSRDAPRTWKLGSTSRPLGALPLTALN